jgi:hypothetical protein
MSRESLIENDAEQFRLFAELDLTPAKSHALWCFLSLCVQYCHTLFGIYTDFPPITLMAELRTTSCKSSNRFLWRRMSHPECYIVSKSTHFALWNPAFYSLQQLSGVDVPESRTQNAALH